MSPIGHYKQEIRIGPEEALTRRGISVVDSKLAYQERCWEDTLLCACDENGFRYRGLLPGLAKTRGEEVFFIFKKLLDDNGMPISDPQEITIEKEHRTTYEKLVEFGALIEEDGLVRIANLNGKLGATFEALTLIAAEDLRLDGARDVQLAYPFKNEQAEFNPDGQKYDVLVGLDLTKLLWIECKKPRYRPESQDPLKNVLNKSTVERFYDRAWLLRPDIAVYLVDTTDNYLDKLKALLTDEFVRSNSMAIEPLEPYVHILARLHNFIYFCRIDYRQKRDSYKGLKNAIRQVLHDSRTYPPPVQFDGSVFR